MFYCSSVVMIVGLVKLNDRLSCSIDRSAGQTGIWAQQRENAYMHGRYLWTQFRWFRPALYTKSQWAYVSTHSTNAWLFATPRLAGTCGMKCGHILIYRHELILWLDEHLNYPMVQSAIQLAAAAAAMHSARNSKNLSYVWVCKRKSKSWDQWMCKKKKSMHFHSIRRCFVFVVVVVVLWWSFRRFRSSTTNFHMRLFAVCVWHCILELMVSGIDAVPRHRFIIFNIIIIAGWVCALGDWHEPAKRWWFIYSSSRSSRIIPQIETFHLKVEFVCTRHGKC